MITTQDKIKAIARKCATANEDIMKLQLGCKFLYREEEMIFVGFSRSGYVLAKHEDGHIWETATQKTPDKFLSEIEILGREIQLADVLFALKQKGCDVGIQDSGCWMQYEKSEDDEMIDWCEKRKANWDLTKGLNGQPIQCIDFIYSLLEE